MLSTCCGLCDISALEHVEPRRNGTHREFVVGHFRAHCTEMERSSFYHMAELSQAAGTSGLAEHRAKLFSNVLALNFMKIYPGTTGMLLHLARIQSLPPKGARVEFKTCRQSTRLVPRAHCALHQTPGCKLRRFDAQIAFTFAEHKPCSKPFGMCWSSMGTAPATSCAAQVRSHPAKGIRK